MSVIVYTTPTCGFCYQLKNYLNQRGVPFVEKDVTQDPGAAAEMVQLSGQQGVPVTAIDGQVVVGFNKPRIDQLLSQQAARPPKLGVSIADARRIAAKKSLPVQPPAGAYVGKVHTGSPASAAGLQRGDVITQLAGQPIRNDQDVHRVMARVQPGQPVQLRFWRNGESIPATIRF